ncbi:MAG TPA: hypothetical protein VFT17_13880 [Propionibacteriaceae bacterium]|nr:hypothetical protein [Propionibacteriaceae bacterium]
MEGRKALQSVAFASDCARGGSARSALQRMLIKKPFTGSESSFSSREDIMMSHPTRSRVTGALLLIGALLLLGACAAGPNELVDTGPDPAGFWLGLWQGLISPITFIVSLFTSSVNIYEVQNNGNWYDFGFMLGVACALGSGGGAGASGARRKRKRSRD